MFDLTGRAAPERCYPPATRTKIAASASAPAYRLQDAREAVDTLLRCDQQEGNCRSTEGGFAPPRRPGRGLPSRPQLRGYRPDVREFRRRRGGVLPAGEVPGRSRGRGADRGGAEHAYRMGDVSADVLYVYALMG